MFRHLNWNAIERAATLLAERGLSNEQHLKVTIRTRSKLLKTYKITAATFKAIMWKLYDTKPLFEEVLVTDPVSDELIYHFKNAPKTREGLPTCGQEWLVSDWTNHSPERREALINLLCNQIRSEYDRANAGQPGDVDNISEGTGSHDD
jgi:hypothetical protein